MAAGASDGKVLGAGGGGFLIFYAPAAAHIAIECALTPLRRIPFTFDDSGSRVIFADG